MAYKGNALATIPLFQGFPLNLLKVPNPPHKYTQNSIRHLKIEFLPYSQAPKVSLICSHSSRLAFSDCSSQGGFPDSRIDLEVKTIPSMLVYTTVLPKLRCSKGNLNIKKKITLCFKAENSFPFRIGKGKSLSV
jgi:hypothetical protein